LVQRPSRLRALAEVEANAQSSAEALDRIAGMACRLLDAPVAIVNLVGSDRQRIVGCGGDPSWTVREMPLTHGFCPFALGAEHAFAFDDARADPAIAANPVVEELGVMAYAGVPLRAAGGEPIGTLCAIDDKPHAWSEDDLACLSQLAASAVAELQLLVTSRQAAREQSRVRALAALSSALARAASADDVIAELRQALDPVQASAAWLALGDSPRVAAATGVDPGAVETLPLPVSEPDFLPAPVPNVGSTALLPLVAGDRRLGVLGVGFHDERALSAEERGYLVALAGISSLALARVERN
jgi:GAF domain-containing protein